MTSAQVWWGRRVDPRSAGTQEPAGLGEPEREKPRHRRQPHRLRPTASSCDGGGEVWLWPDDMASCVAAGDACPSAAVLAL
jgi:hypothetical protein